MLSLGEDMKAHLALHVMEINLHNTIRQ